MRTRTLIALLASVVGSLGVVGAAAVGARAGVKGQRAAAQRVVDMLPIHADWWRERQQHEGQLLYVAIGDSAAQGVGATAPGRGYVGLLTRRIRHRSHMSVRVVNLSVSGSTTWGAKRDQLPKLRHYAPDICTVSIGANDIADFNPDKFEAEHPGDLRRGPLARRGGRVAVHVRAGPGAQGGGGERDRAPGGRRVRADGGAAAHHHEARRCPPHLLQQLRRPLPPERPRLRGLGERVPSRRSTPGSTPWRRSGTTCPCARPRTSVAEAGAVANARAEQDTDGAEALDHASRQAPGPVERLRHRMTGSIAVPDDGDESGGHGGPDEPGDRAGDVGRTA
ncbi:SGNH/GDSL hydrolase family protein [Curtobacterium flaccumfaciens]|nr:SGNH/GDSL hydrolase family protein [Curtobacterium flaccumfaciens]